MSAPILSTPRLMLRQWLDSDLPAFAALNADPQVMRYFPAVLHRQESDALAARIRHRLDTAPFGLWAMQIDGVTDFAGFLGLSVPSFEASFMPCVEVGWRLARPYWKKGYASEGARAVLDYAFHTLNLPQIVAYTAAVNTPSITLMQRLGMHHCVSNDFAHPALPEGHPLRQHVLYRLTQADW
ncbi:GNAT family N-acetyltransferase [Advenella sp. S44]|uniref:GNAT family N-acetyltransferase n=1 Tax=Advenella sp. S44 TaxID=1982755 RepID=UPI000C296664|nr:GNAT family N-acetyltransferase [Advenella sp. S44]PJX22253.1 GNAT family N-acetyltransferase [Advenella sp. S44]